MDYLICLREQQIFIGRDVSVSLIVRLYFYTCEYKESTSLHLKVSKSVKGTNHAPTCTHMITPSKRCKTSSRVKWKIVSKNKTYDVTCVELSSDMWRAARSETSHSVFHCFSFHNQISCFIFGLPSQTELSFLLFHRLNLQVIHTRRM